MKKFTQILLFIFISFSVESLSQDFIKDFPGIPIIVGYDGYYNNRGELLDSMGAMGVNFIHGNVLYPTDTLNLLNSLYGLKVIPVKTKSNSDTLNWIQYYTDAKYSVWETEDTAEDTSFLQHDPNVMYDTSDGNNGYIKLRSSAVGNRNTLIWGPYYNQEIRYRTSINGAIDTVFYTADFRLKVELNTSYTNVDTVNPNTPLCIIQVTQSYVSTSGGVWHLPCTYTIDSLVLTRGDFLSLNNFQEYSLLYRLSSDSCQGPSRPPTNLITSYENMLQIIPRVDRQYIQFNVVWLGNPNFQLSIDKVTISDSRGRDLKDFNSPAITNIVAQLNTLPNSVVTGWLGIDEPLSLDNFEPIRIVDSLLDAKSNNQRPLWIALMGRWDGVWENKLNPFGVMHLSPWKEFKKRVGEMNVWQNAYMYDIPYKSNYGPGDSCNCEDFRTENIEIAAIDNMEQAYQLDNNFGVSLQCGAIYNPSANAVQRNPTATELLYNANLALMFGAKFFDLYTYFAQRNISDSLSGYTYHGIVDFNNDVPQYTDKYYMFYEKLNPRLKGTFGITLKTLIPDTQFVAWQAIDAVYYPTVSYSTGKVKKIEVSSTETSNNKCFIDLGFFHKPEEYNKSYFMPLNRYFSNKESLRFTLNNLYTYKNWNLTDYVEDTTIYLATDENLETVFYDTISSGDAHLYSIAPTIIYGGTLTADETLQNTATLQSDLIVDPGVTLTINNSLTSYGDIRLMDGSKLCTTNSSIGGTITFLQGKKLMIDGEVEINGLPDKKLTFDFTTPVDDNGIKVYNKDKLTIKNVLIKNAYRGIFIDEGELYIDSSEVRSCNTGLYLNETIYQVDMHEGSKIWNSNIHDNECGITFLDGSAMIAGNDISNNSYYGVECLESSGPILGELLEPGLNYLNNNKINLYSYISYPTAGICGDEYIAGYNSFEGNDVENHVAAIEKSYVIAEQNWWGDREPNPNLFKCDDESYLDYIPFLLLPPLESKGTMGKTQYANASSNVGLELILPTENYKRALKYLISGDNYNCRLLLKNILMSYSDSIAAFAALNLLSKTYINSTGQDSLKTYLQQFTTSNLKKDIFVYAKLLLADFDKNNYSANLNSILISHTNSKLKDLVYFKKFKHYLFDKNSRDSAVTVSNQMASLFPESPLTRESKFLLGDDILQKNSANMQSIPLNYFIGNYPNPFNPVTTIRYELPKSVKVNISVYDILGRRVKELVNEEKEPGRYEIQFNVNNLSSGVYFYRIVTTDFVSTKKMMILK